MPPRKGSNIFSSYRALALFCNHVPHVVRFHQKHRQFYLVTAVGTTFHTYNVKKLGIVAVSNPLPEDITCLAADRMLVFAAHGNYVKAFARNKDIVHTYEGHNAEVHLLLPFGDHMVSVDRDNTLIIWDVKSEEEYLQLNFDKIMFTISALLHPSTYINKILLGSQQGSLQLWNVKSNKLLYTFQGWNSSVSVLQQAPAVDVAAVGLASGMIIIHNLKYDEMLMKFQQDWGPVTAISFRTDGFPVMAVGSQVGHIGLWDLEEKKLISQMREIHTTAISGLTFVHGEPLLITTGEDNAIRVWIFDAPGGGGRLLRCRMGHSAPPTKIKYHGSDGKNILSSGQDGTLQSFSTIHESFNKSLGHGCRNKKKSKMKGLNYDVIKLPPITTFASETARENYWDGIIACHQGYQMTTTWNYQKSTIGSHKFKPQKFQEECSQNVYATAVDITSCGNFAVVGLSSGYVDVYNIQSGIHRGRYGQDKTHDSQIRGVAVDGLNQLTITAGGDKLVKFWKFKSKQLICTTTLDASPITILLHRDSGMLALAMDDFRIAVLDSETRKFVRRFIGHQNQINDMAFSPDGRWLITASMDCTIRTWDLPSGCLIDCFLLDSAAVSITMSPTGDFLATAHVDNLGIYLWSNKTLYDIVSLRPLPADYQSTAAMIPGACQQEDLEMSDSETEVEGQMIEYDSCEQLGEQLVTLSLLPESRWKNLLNLDIIKKRNKPKEPPKVPKSAPFFIPTISGLVPQFAAVEQQAVEEQSKVVNLGVLAQKTELHMQLEDALNTNNYDHVIKHLKGMGPSSIDIELRNLAPEGGGSLNVMQSFLQMISYMLCTKRDFELSQAYLALYLKLHLKVIAAEPVLLEEMSKVSVLLEDTWMHMQTLFNKNMCLLGYMKSALL
ncbi:WD repeat-containing protein 36 [Narcine bancroftii]|uniref:WD repeat-containing protein 36 n=1 Tax=Narcine bancroftii TaxID=1343680 RepID=UPI003831CBBE